MDLSKVKVAGVYQVFWKSQDLGHTVDGFEVTVDRRFTEVKVDAYGDSLVDMVLNGTRADIKFKLAQDQWLTGDTAMPETSSYDGTGSQDRIDIGGDPGFSLRSQAGPLRLHPRGVPLTDDSQDITFYLTANTANFELPIKVDEQKTFQMGFSAFVSEAYGAGRRLGHVGPAGVS